MRFLALALSFGCPETANCTAIAAASVVVTVIDPDGAPVLDADVTWEQAGGERMPCEPLNDDGLFVCGYEVAGDIDIHVEADGFAPWDGTVTVVSGEDDCHVEGVELTAELEFEPSPADA